MLPFLKDTLLHRYFQFWTVLLDCVSCPLRNNSPLGVVSRILFFKRLLKGNYITASIAFTSHLQSSPALQRL